MPLQADKKEQSAPDVLKTLGDALKAAGFAQATVRKTEGVHDAVITIVIPKGT